MAFPSIYAVFLNQPDAALEVDEIPQLCSAQTHVLPQLKPRIIQSKSMACKSFGDALDLVKLAARRIERGFIFGLLFRIDRCIL